MDTQPQTPCGINLSDLNLGTSSVGSYWTVCMVPTGNQEIRENLGKWEGIFQSGKSQEISSRLEKSGNFTQKTGKLKRILEK